jgi:hypothetical protein
MVRTNSANTAEWLDYPAAVLRLPREDFPIS